MPRLRAVPLPEQREHCWAPTPCSSKYSRVPLRCGRHRARRRTRPRSRSPDRRHWSPKSLVSCPAVPAVFHHSAKLLALISARSGPRPLRSHLQSGNGGLVSATMHGPRSRIFQLRGADREGSEAKDVLKRSSARECSARSPNAVPSRSLRDRAARRARRCRYGGRPYRYHALAPAPCS